MAKSNRDRVAEIDAKIAKLNEERAKFLAAAENEVNHDDVQSGRTVTFNYGKAPNVRELTGLVLGRKEPEAGTKGAPLVKVAVGAGFEAQIVTIYPAQVTKVHAEEVPPSTDAE